MPFFSPTFIIAILVAIAIHEWAHAYTAYRLGDATAKMEGRMTVNPLAHLDPMGTLLFVLIGFGWGKPVPVNPHELRHPRRDHALVAFAGPLSNLVVAFVASFLLTFIDGNVVTRILEDILHVNLILMAFNLLPIAPLDGSKVLELFIPLQFQERYASLMQKGPWILLFLIIAARAFDLDVFGWWVELWINPILRLMEAMASGLSGG